MRAILNILPVLLFFTATSQTIIPRFETLGVNEGLSQNSVYAIFQDSEGFMWFGTADGLNRYDGDEIKIYKTQTDLNKKGNSNFIRGNLCEDKKGNIWFSTETGLYYYDRMLDELILSFSFPESNVGGIIYYLLATIDKHDNLWLYNRVTGVASWQINTTTWKLYPVPYAINYSKLVTGEYTSLDAEGNILYSLYPGEELYKFNIRETKYEQLKPAINYSLWSFGKSKFFFASGSTIYRYDSLTRQLDSFLLNVAGKNISSLASMFEDSYGRLWICTFTDGLLYYDFKIGKLHQYQQNFSGQKNLSSNDIKRVAEDRSGNLWIGTDGGGVCKLDLKPPFFNLFPQSEGEYPLFKNSFIKSIFEDEQKRIWFGTLNGLNIYDPDDGSLKQFLNTKSNPLNLPDNIVSTIFRDDQGTMWIGHGKGISVFNENTQTFKSVQLQTITPFDIGSNFVFRIRQLKSGKLMAATSKQFLMIKKIGPDNYIATYKFKGGELCPSTITDFLEMDNGDIWFVSPLIGLYHGIFLNDSLILRETFFTGIDFRSLHKDDKDPHFLWLASGKGLIRFDTRAKKHELFNENHGLSNSYIYGILEDEKNNLWISTNGGLSQFDKTTHRFINYTWKDGLQSNEFNTGAFYKGASGNFYFGGVKGFNWFHANNFPQNETKPGIGITSILIRNTPFRKDSSFLQNKTISLNYLQNDLLFQVAALDFTKPEANKIQYKLEGWNDNWITTYNKQIRYGKLLPGHYTFIVKASNNAGEWSDEERIIIIINAPFWQRTWFYILCGSLILGAVVLITRNLAQRKIKEKLRQLEKQRAVEAERNRISKDMHDEIGSGLTRIALMTELMNTSQQLTPDSKQNVDEIAGSTRKLVESMSEIIWALNPQNDKLDNLLAYLREQTRHYFEPLNILYKIDFPDSVPDVKLSNEQKRNIFLVSREALNNALKHSGATSIELSAYQKNGKFEFSVTDNGKGINRDSIRTGANGLRNMQQRMTDIKGGIEWMSYNGSGTKVIYWINI